MLKIFDKMYKNKTFMVFFVGILLIIVQLIFAFYALISSTLIKGENFDIWLVVFFRVVLAVFTTLIMALIFEGRFSPFNIDKKYYYKLLYYIVDLYFIFVLLA